MKILRLSLLSLFFAPILLSAQSRIKYTLSMPEPHTHYYEVSMEIADAPSTLNIKMPVWAPGSYLVREFAKSVEDFKATKNGNALEARKINKNTWQISNARGTVTLSYRVYAYELSVRTSFIDASHGYLNGTSIFMYVEDKKDLPITLKVNPYKDWNTVSTGLEKIGKWEYKAPHYDILVDAPIEIGNHELMNFEAAGVDHQIAMYGDGNFNKDQLLADMTKVAQVCTDVIGENPNEDYLFIIHNLTRASGGLEHLNSTTLQVNRWTYQGNNYLRFLSLVAHEYFHLWNVKRIRPLELGPFNYDEENYTSLLWVMEGFTSYYDELLLKRAGFYEEDAYLKVLANTISSVENRPGNRVQPVAASSFDTWIKQYRPNENSYNTTISYYPKGALVAAVFDLEIISATKGRKNLDDVMQYLYSEYYKKQDRGFTADEMQKAIEKIAGKSMKDFFNRYIDGAETIDYNTYLNKAGFELINTNEGSDKAHFGARTRDNNGRLMVQGVTRGTAAYKYGVNANDEILAIDGYRVNQSEFNRLMGFKKPGDNIKLMIARDGQVQELDIELGANEQLAYQIVPMTDRSKSQERVYKKWLNIE